MFNWIKNLLGKKEKPLLLTDPVKTEETKPTAHSTAEMPEEHVALVKKKPAAKKAAPKKKAVAETPAVAPKKRGRPAKKAD